MLVPSLSLSMAKAAIIECRYLLEGQNGLELYIRSTMISIHTAGNIVVLSREFWSGPWKFGPNPILGPSPNG